MRRLQLFIQLALSAVAAICLSGCSQLEDLIVVNEYNTPIRVFTEDGKLLLAGVALHGVTLAKRAIYGAGIGPKTPCVLRIEDDSGRFLADRSISEDEDRQNNYGTGVIISVGPGPSYKPVTLSVTRR